MECRGEGAAQHVLERFRGSTRQNVRRLAASLDLGVRLYDLRAVIAGSVVALLVIAALL